MYGTSKTDPGLSGAAIGAGTGAALGAACALTDKDQIELGKPAWRLSRSMDNHVLPA